MPSVTLAESAKLSQDMLIAGVIENVVSVNPLFDILPFEGIEGNALGYNRENALGDVQMLAVGGTITAKAAATFTYVTSPLTTIIGDAEVNGLIQATRSNKTDQRSTQVASKAKSAGRQYQDQMINGNGTGANMTGLLALCDPAKVVGAGGNAANGAALSFADLDLGIRTVIDKEGQLDFIMMAARTIDSYLALLRAAGGAGINETMELPSGRKVIHYRGVPIFRNDWIPTNQTKGATTTCTSVLFGTFDDGSYSHGISGLTAREQAGIQVREVGWKETADEDITRVVWYSGLALFSLNGLAVINGVTN
jgi:hypothetical protein